MKTYNLMMEGYQATGESAPAQFLGSFQADSLQAACEQWISAKPERKVHFNKEQLTFWGCKFYEVNP